MEPRTNQRRFILCLLVAVLGVVGSTRATEYLRIDPAAWQLERTWKSAHEKGGARYHFYSGKSVKVQLPPTTCRPTTVTRLV